MIRQTILFLLTAACTNAQVQLRVNDDIETQVGSVRQIQSSLDSLLSAENELGTLYHLDDYSDNQSLFEYKSKEVTLSIDTLNILRNGLHPFVNQRILNKLKGNFLSKEIETTFRQILLSYPFLESNSSLLYYLHHQSNIGIGLKIDLKHKFDSSIGGIAAAERNDSNIWNITGQMDMHLENLWSTAGTIILHWRRINDNTQNITFEIEEPFLYFAPFGSRFTFHQDYRNGEFISTDWGLSLLQTQPGIGMWGFGYQSKIVLSSPKGDSLGIEDAKFHSLMINNKADHRNHRYITTEGSYWDLSFVIGNSSNSTMNSLVGEYSIIGGTYLKFEPNFSVLGKVFSKGVFGTTHEAMLIRYGGLNSLRGFNEDILTSKIVTIPTIECIFTLNQTMQFNVFSEVAIQREINPYPYSYGFGFKQNARQAIFSIQYGLSNGSKLPEGKLHISVISRI